MRTYNDWCKLPFFQKSLVLWQFFHASKDLQDLAFPIDFLHISTEKHQFFKNPDSYLVKKSLPILVQLLCRNLVHYVLSICVPKFVPL